MAVATGAVRINANIAIGLSMLSTMSDMKKLPSCHLPPSADTATPSNIRRGLSPSSYLAKSDRRKRSPQKKSNSSGNGNGGVSFSSLTPETKGNFMVGQVRILKRGEGLGDTAPLKKIGEKVERVESESVFGKQPETTPKKKFNIADFYAGSACDSSPPPSSLPVPGFFKKKTILVENNDYATCDLRRLLRLDLS
nr:serine/arginine repetitive matrix-like protein [Ipomoea batatas]